MRPRKFLLISSLLLLFDGNELLLSFLHTDVIVFVAFPVLLTLVGCADGNIAGLLGW